MTDCCLEVQQDFERLRMADAKIRSRQESTESVTSSNATEGYSEDDKDNEMDDLNIIKTVGTGTFGRVLLCRNKSTDEYFAMKILNLSDVIRLKQVEHVKNEKNILLEIRHPFVVNFGSAAFTSFLSANAKLVFSVTTGGKTRDVHLITHLPTENDENSLFSRRQKSRSVCQKYGKTLIRPTKFWCHRDDTSIYMLFEYVCGGELFSYLRNAGRFSSPTANFYACEIISAVDYLHLKNIVYRDLKPENLLLDKEGHLKITDFGFAKKLTDRTWTLCGTPEYLAPEIIQSKGHNKAVDWWALGILIYEMLVGYPPFYDDNPFGIYEKILSGKIEWVRHMDPIAKDLIKKLLVQDRTKRLGNMKVKSGAEDIKRHRWFKGVDWQDVIMRKLKPPIVPKITSDGDTSNFDEYPEVDFRTARPLEDAELKLFEDF